MLAIIAIAALCALVYTSISEWLLHRYVMHRPVGNFRYAFEAHTMTHHRLMRADETYHLNDLERKNKIRMAWWNGPAIVAIGGIPFYLMAWGIGAASAAWAGWTIALTGVVVFASYYVVYERLHWCMHLPKSRRLERWRVFHYLNGHHVLHHRYMDSNLNVVLPLADLMFGTLLLRSKKPFCQVRGPSVPDLQPLSA